MAEMKKLGIRVEGDVRSKLRQTAKRTGASQAEIVRRILKRHLK